MTGSWADGVAVVHAALVVLVLTGGFVAWRHPAVRLLHLPVVAGVVAVNLTGSACPLTVLEQRLRVAEGRAPYTGGFIGHHLVEPLLGVAASPALPGLLCAAAVVPNVVAYGVPLLRRALASRDRVAGVGSTVSGWWSRGATRAGAARGARPRLR